MYKGKRAKSTKNIYVMASLVLLIAFAVGGTVAYISMKTDPVTNTFTLGTVPIKVVEDITTEPGVKNDVQIQNIGDVDAYIRAKVIFNWVKWNDVTKQYDVSGTPVNDSDYEIDWTKENWTNELGGYYYYKGKVPPKSSEPDNVTGVLFTDCKLKEGITPPDGYTLSVEILAQSIQTDGVDSNNKTPVEIAWGEAAAKAVGAK